MKVRTTYGILPASAFSLGVSAGPARWGGDASPRQAVVGKRYVVVDAGNEATIARRLSQDHDGTVHVVSSSASDDPGWFDRTFRPAPEPLDWADPVIRDLHHRFPGLWSLTDGGLFEGLLTSIVGQSISIASAMAAQRRLALSFAPGVEVDGRLLVPPPPAEALADASVELIRASGVTWKRAEALKAIAKEAVNGTLPSATEDREVVERELRRLPMVGPWTAASALLWGTGHPDAYPAGDVALLRAARFAYDRPGMTMTGMDALAERWRPHRGIATRLLWTGLLGPGWEVE